MSDVVFVTGPPAAGKTTLARQMVADGGLLVDLDLIASTMTGDDPHSERSPAALSLANAAAKAARKSAVSLSANGRLSERVVIVRGLPLAHDRLTFANLCRSARMIVLPCPSEICVARIKADPARTSQQAAVIEAVERWWRAYRPARCDEVVVTW